MYSTTLSDVKVRLDKEFSDLNNELGQELIEKVICHVYKRIAFFQAENSLEDEQLGDDEATESDEEFTSSKDGVIKISK